MKNTVPMILILFVTDAFLYHCGTKTAATSKNNGYCVQVLKKKKLFVQYNTGSFQKQICPYTRFCEKYLIIPELRDFFNFKTIDTLFRYKYRTNCTLFNCWNVNSYNRIICNFSHVVICRRRKIYPLPFL